MDGLEARMDKLESRMDKLESRMDKLESRMDKLENDLQSFRKNVDERFTRLEKKLEGIRAELTDAQETLDFVSSKTLKHEKSLDNYSLSSHLPKIAAIFFPFLFTFSFCIFSLFDKT